MECCRTLKELNAVCSELIKELGAEYRPAIIKHYKFYKDMVTE